MTTEIFFSSNKLGAITDEQLQLVLDRFALGKLISATKTAKGVGNQTLFVRSTTGEYVLKGNPLYAGQFIEEKFYVDNLVVRTNLPVPAPYLVDESTDVFGWPYALMPRLPGQHISEPALRASLGSNDQEQIAALLAVSLRQLHGWQVDHFGEFIPKSRQIRPFQGSYKAWLYARVRYWLDDAANYSVITPEDRRWVGDLLVAAEGAFDNLCSPSYVMGDFKADNILVQGEAGSWCLSGIFDFTNGYFGDGLADLPKIIIMYLNVGETQSAERFMRAYFADTGAKEGTRERMRVHLLMQCILDWGCAKATNTVTWNNQLSFSEWATKYIDVVREGWL